MAPRLIAQDGLPMGRRVVAMVALALGLTLAVLDGAIANVALPSLARQFAATAAQSIWIVSAYQVAVSVCLLPLAALGEATGYRRVYLAGLVLFTAASLGCAFSGNLPTLVAWRIVQGLGAAGIMSVNSALLRFIFPLGQLGRGVSINATVVAVASAIGPSIASAILSVTTWPWLFAINLPIGLAAVTVGSRALPWTPASGRTFDLKSAGLNVATFGFLLLGFDAIAHGQDGEHIAAYLLLAAGAGIVYVRRESDREAPMLPVDLLRRPIFALSIGTSMFSFAAQMLAFVSLPFFLEAVLQRSPVETGLLMTPWPVTIVFVAPISGILADRFAAGILGGIGLFIFAVGLALLSILNLHAEPLQIGLRMALCGLGFGLFQSPNNRTILSSAPPERSGGASGMLGTARLLGQTSGAALAALVFTALGPAGATNSLRVAAGTAVCAAVVSALRVSSRGRSSEPVAAREGIPPSR